MRSAVPSIRQLTILICLAVLLSAAVGGRSIAQAAAADVSARDQDGDGALDSDEALLGVDLRATRVLYVAPDGDDMASGTYAAPLATLQRALTIATGGETILVLPGMYPAATTTSKYSATVGVYGVPRGGTQPEIAGLDIMGAQHLLLRGLKFTATAQVTSHPTLKAAQPAIDIHFDDDDLTYPEGLCLRIRSGATDVQVRDSQIHDCQTGIGGPVTDDQSSGITIANNVLAHFAQDAIQFGTWDNVDITGNVIGYVQDPAGVVHNDVIQFTGGSSHVVIRDNTLHDSAQLLFVQPAFGLIDDVDVENNVMHGARAYAVQIQGSTHVRFIHNTVWDSHYGGVLLREGTSPAGTIVPTDTVITDNVLSGYGTTGAAHAAVFARNVVATDPHIAGQDILIAAPEFRDAPSGDFALIPGSPGYGWGALTTTGAPGSDAPDQSVDAATPPATSGGSGPAASVPPAQSLIPSVSSPAPPDSPVGPTAPTGVPANTRRGVQAVTHPAQAKTAVTRRHRSQRARALAQANRTQRRQRDAALRDLVQSFHGCLPYLSRVDRRVLVVRARLKASHAWSRRRAARRLKTSVRRVSTIERHGARGLRIAGRRYGCAAGG